jgi:hypothetical protein
MSSDVRFWRVHGMPLEQNTIDGITGRGGYSDIA